MTLIASAMTLVMVWRWRSLTPHDIDDHRGCRVTDHHPRREGDCRPSPAPLSDAVPPYEHAFSFPSGHTLNSTVIARHGRISRRNPAHQPPRHRPVRHSGHRLGGGNGV